MCLNSTLQNAQIEKLVESGMPRKAIKTVQYTLRKRGEAYEKAKRVQEYKTQVKIDAQQQQASTTVHQKIPAAKLHFSNLSATATTTMTTTTTATDFPYESQNDLVIPKLCQRFLKENLNKLNRNNNNNNSNSSSSNNNGVVNKDNITNCKANKNDTTTPKTIQNDEQVYDDILASSTRMLKQFLNFLNVTSEKFQRSWFYILLTKTTQPAHIIAVSILAIILLTLYPELHVMINNDVNAMKTASSMHHVKKPNILATLVYLGAFATHFGAIVFMTFISAISLYFALPRHTFGQCQTILFPRYFAFNGMLSLCMLLVYLKYFLSSWNLVNCLEVCTMAVTVFFELGIRLYVVPPMLRAMREKFQIESSAGLGKEIGEVSQGDLALCPYYTSKHKRFRRIHMVASIGNVMIFTAACLHLYLIAVKINLNLG